MFNQEKFMLMTNCGYLRRYNEQAFEDYQSEQYQLMKAKELEESKRLLLGKTRVLKCCYCDKVFESLQAFGGHHNKHRKEREVLMNEHKEYLTRSRDETKLTLSTPSLASSSSSISLPNHGVHGDVCTKEYLDQLERRFEGAGAMSNAKFSCYDDVDVTLKL